MATSLQSNFICDCSDFATSACQGESFFKEHEGKHYCVLHYPGKDKTDQFRAAVKRKLEAEDFNFSEVWFPEPINFDWFTFSTTAHFFNVTFSAAADFSRVTFSSDVYFTKAIFKTDALFVGARFNANAYFSDATFSACTDFEDALFKKEAGFCNARFGAWTDFGGASFSADARFEYATFSAEANFDNTNFRANAHFEGAIFNADATFRRTTFNNKTRFDYATFNNYAHFAGSDDERQLDASAEFSFQHSHFEKPERVSFHTLDLRPHWFVNVDSRKFVFTDVEFNYVLVDELASLKEREVSAPHRLLAIACRQLADNAEANHRYGEASELRFSAFEARRLEKSQPPFPWQIEWWRRSAILIKKTLERTFTGVAPWRLEWWYWLASGYGESVGHALFIFVLLLSLFAFGYMFTAFEPQSKPAITKLEQTASSQLPDLVQPNAIRLGWEEAVRYSINVALLQKPDPKPRGRLGSWLVIVETILGPAQAALLALAVRRRFMR